MPGPANDLNISQSGFVTFDGVATFAGRTLTAGTGVTISNGNGVLANPVISATGSVPIQFTGNSGIATPVANNLNVLTANSTPKVVGSGSTLTLDFGLTNLILGSNATTITSGSGNVGIGLSALGIVTSGFSNTALGFGALSSLTTGTSNVAIGTNALAAGNNTTCTAVGRSALAGNTGGNNTAIGANTLQAGSGSNNTVLGIGAGNSYTGTESSNLLLQHAGILGENNTIRIGTQGSSGGQQNRAFIAGVTGVTVSASAPIAIDTNGQLSSLGFGTSTQVLTSNGAGVSPTWQAAATGTVTSVSGTANRITSTGGATPVIDISASYVGQSSITTLGTVTTGVWNGTSVDLAHGGTNANLTASNGGIFYSTSTGGAILAGTATAGQILRSGASTTPAWSTATYPATAGTSGNILTSDGTNWNSSAPSGVILTASNTLTNSQIKNLHATPIQVIAAPGSGKVILVHRAVAKLNYGGNNAFTAPGVIGLYYATTTIAITSFMGNAAITSSLTNTTLQTSTFANMTYTTVENTALNIYNPNVTEVGGNAANDNTISWYIEYTIVTI